MPKYKATPLLKTVIEGGYCIGCGACAAVPESPFTMKMDHFGKYHPALDPKHRDSHGGTDIGHVCPFYAHDSEDTLARNDFSRYCDHNNKIGYFLALYSAYVRDTQDRLSSSSGGIVTWLLTRLVHEGHIQGVIHVGPTSNSFKNTLFEYQISRSRKSIRANVKSRYYPVEISNVIPALQSNPGQFAFIGVPCYVKALKLMAKRHSLIRKKIAFTIGIFCGHMKTVAFAQSLAWQLGVSPNELSDIDFRHKLSRRPANRYGIRVTSKSGTTTVAKKQYLFGTDWGLGFFKPKACDFCDDIVGETADLSSGDAWLPQYVENSHGTSVLVVRNPMLNQILLRGKEDGEIHLERVNADDIVQSQAGNFRHRHDGLAYRLAQLDAQGKWRPKKRIEANTSHLSDKRKLIYSLRRDLSETSHSAFQLAKKKGSFQVFEREMASLVGAYYDANGVPRVALVLRNLYAQVYRSLKRVIKFVTTFFRQ